MTWHTGRLAAFDLETTSPNPDDARIVTACVAFVGGGLGTQTRKLYDDLRFVLEVEEMVDGMAMGGTDDA